MTKQKIEIFETSEGQAQITVRFEHETIWLSQAQMAELFDKDSDTIGLHLKNIFKTEELDEKATTEDFSVVRQEGNTKSSVTRSIHPPPRRPRAPTRGPSMQSIQKRSFSNQQLPQQKPFNCTTLSSSDSNPWIHSNQKQPIIHLIMDTLAKEDKQP